MKKYKYIRADEIEKYEVENIVNVFPGDDVDYCLIELYQDKPIQNYIKLHEATTYELLAELKKILDKGASEDEI